MQSKPVDAAQYTDGGGPVRIFRHIQTYRTLTNMHLKLIEHVKR